MNQEDEIELSDEELDKLCEKIYFIPQQKCIKAFVDNEWEEPYVYVNENIETPDSSIIQLPDAEYKNWKQKSWDKHNAEQWQAAKNKIIQRRRLENGE